MARIESVEIFQVDVGAWWWRTDACRASSGRETPIVRITDADGAVGVGNSYTVGTGGSSRWRGCSTIIWRRWACAAARPRTSRGCGAT